MAENSKIEWTDHTFNPWMGCTKVSPACKNCYAERDMDHRYGKVAWGPSGTRVKTSEDNWRKPLRWNREAKEQSIRYRVFCASLADVFEDWKGPMVDHHGEQIDSTMDDLRRDLFELIDATPNLDWLLLTKRPENIRAKWHPFNWQTPSDVPHRSNVWLGTSVESSDYLSRIDSLKAAGGLASVLFISAEPVVGPMPTLGEYLGGIDWVITGGESGPDARPADPEWFRSIRDQCEMHNVPFHFKQWGEFDEHQKRVGKKAAGRLLDGEEHDGVPLLAAGF
jgi:protein gp37